MELGERGKGKEYRASVISHNIRCEDRGYKMGIENC
jgi:hypothetical protein